MKKIVFCFLVLLTVCSCKKNNIYNNSYLFKSINYYKKEYLNRYIDFKNNNPELSYEDVVTRVNIGLDKPFYNKPNYSDYLNSIYILINKYIKVPDNYKPNDLVLMKDFSKDNIYLVKEAYDNFIHMASAAKDSGLNIRVISAYRDVLYQEELYSKYREQDSIETVDTYSARPGFSEHHTGLCIDIDNITTSYEYFEYTDEYQWMTNNSYKYGYILRYPKNKEHITGYMYEAWHFRYVGKKAAKYIHRNNITYDEYFVRFIENKKEASI